MSAPLRRASLPTASPWHPPLAPLCPHSCAPSPGSFNPDCVSSPCTPLLLYAPISDPVVQGARVSTPTMPHSYEMDLGLGGESNSPPHPPPLLHTAAQRPLPRGRDPSIPRPRTGRALRARSTVSTAFGTDLFALQRGRQHSRQHTLHTRTLLPLRPPLEPVCRPRCLTPPVCGNSGDGSVAGDAHGSAWQGDGRALPAASLHQDLDVPLETPPASGSK